MRTDERQQERPWAINKTCLRISLGLAILATLESLFAALFALATGQRSALLWAAAAAWPACYGIVYLIAYCIARIDQQGPLTDQLGWLGKPFGPFRPLLDGFYHVTPNVALLLFPLNFASMAAVLVWCAVTRQLNP